MSNIVNSALLGKWTYHSPDAIPFAGKADLAISSDGQQYLGYLGYLNPQWGISFTGAFEAGNGFTFTGQGVDNVPFKLVGTVQGNVLSGTVSIRGTGSFTANPS